MFLMVMSFLRVLNHMTANAMPSMEKQPLMARFWLESQ